jgi:cation diffusion facilitator CzcD-associated flavoprotein CzcO
MPSSTRHSVIANFDRKDMNDTVDKFGLREHFCFNVECIGAKWNPDKYWEVRFRDTSTNAVFTRCATVVISAVGAISYPKLVQFKGLETYTGRIFHTASWDHSYDYEGKRMAVIGNGCSAAQVVPNVVHNVAYLKQYARGAQW